MNPSQLCSIAARRRLSELLGVVAVFDNYQTRSNRWISMSSFAKNLPPGWIFSPKRAGIKNEPRV